MRKTVEVQTVRELLNTALGVPDSTLRLDPKMTRQQIHRQAIASVLEMILHHTDNYRGFGYVGQQAEDGSMKPDADETKRVYY